MKKTRSLFPILFLLLMIFVSFRFLFFVSYIHLQKSNFRQQIVNSNYKELVKLNFQEKDLFIDKNGFEWKEKNKELLLNGSYYEVIKIEKLKDHVEVSVIADKAENLLFETYFKLNKNLHDSNTNLINLLLNLTYLNTPFQIDLRHYFQKIIEPVTFVHFTEQNYVLKSIKPPQNFFL